MRVVLTGASGQLGAYLIPRLRIAGHAVSAWSGAEQGGCSGLPFEPIDLTDASIVASRLDSADPDIVIHTAAISSADAVRRDPRRAEAVNVDATETLARWCDRRGRRLVFTSTDLVFDGSKPWNREDDPTEPVLAYGQTKRAAEIRIAGFANVLVVRLSLLYGLSRNGKTAFFDGAVAAIGRGEPRAFFEDEFRAPLDFASAADALVRLAEIGATGIVHAAGAERMSRYELMRRTVESLGLDSRLVRANRRGDVVLTEPRPADGSLDTSKLLTLLPGLRRPTVEEVLRSGIFCETETRPLV